MKITRRQLKKIITESLREQAEDTSSLEDINITMDVPGREGITFSFKAVGNKVDAFFENEEGKVKK